MDLSKQLDEKGTDDGISTIKHNIAVIGAGASGIIVGKRLKEAGIPFTTFEQRKKTGGIWSPQESADQKWFNPIYDNLITNLPKEVMEYWGSPWDAVLNEGEKTPSFQLWPKVCDYLDRVAEIAQLEENTCFDRVVTNIEPLGEPGEHKGYNVTTEGINDKITRKEFFTGVAVCNGHYNKPVWPTLPDQDLFIKAGGKMSHSVNWTNADGYKDKRVIVIGSGPSGRDLKTELFAAGANVIFSCREAFQEDLMLKGVHYATGIQGMNDMRIVSFQDGTVSAGPVDEIICATGYDYDMPFLSQDIAPINTIAKNGYQGVDNLYLQVFNIKYPTLWFVGLPSNVVPWPLADSQAKAIVSVLTGVTKLPDFESRQLIYTGTDFGPSGNIHGLAGKSWDYILMMLEFAKDFELVPNAKLRARIHADVSQRRKKFMDTYRQSEYTLTTCNDDTIGGGYFEVQHPQFPLSREETDLTINSICGDMPGGTDETVGITHSMSY